MQTIGKYYDGETARPQTVELFLVLSTNTLEVILNGEAIYNLKLDFIKILSFSKRHLVLEVNEVSNATIEIEDEAFINYFEEFNDSNGGFSWHRRIIHSDNTKFFRYLAVFIGALSIFYFFILPIVLSSAVDSMSMDVDQKVGNLVFSSLEEEESFNIKKGELLTDFYRSITPNPAPYVQIHLDNSPTVNAFALPGGHIVVYRGLLEKITGPEELAALISHELTHVEKRHTMKMLAENSTNAFLMNVVVGNVGGLEFGRTLLISMKQMSFSRELEEEADKEGLRYLKNWHVNPVGFVRLFSILKSESKDDNSPSLFDSHPALDERTALIKKLSKDQPYQPMSSKSIAIFKELTAE